VSNDNESGIKNPVYIGGVSFDRGPNPVVLNVIRAEAKNRNVALGLAVDRLLVGTGYPNVMNTHEITNVWPDIREAKLLDQLGVLTAMGQPFDVCIWKLTRDVFSGDGVTKDFFIQRRALSPTVNVPTGIPSTSFPDYDTTVELWSGPLGQIPAPTLTTSFTVVHKTNATIDSSDPASGEAWIEDDGRDVGGGHYIAKVRLGAAPPDADDVLKITYVPLYRMTIDQQAQQSFGPKLVEPRGIKLVEV